MTTEKTAVNFYILPDSDLDKRLHFVFRLVEKAFAQHLPTLIIAADDVQLQDINQLIWRAQPSSFIPHEMIDEELVAPLPSILLTDSVSKIAPLDFSPQVVIDLSHEATPLSFPKIMLVANQHEEVLANARMKYQSYANFGIKPTVHKL